MVEMVVPGEVRACAVELDSRQHQLDVTVFRCLDCELQMARTRRKSEGDGATLRRPLMLNGSM